MTSEPNNTGDQTLRPTDEASEEVVTREELLDGNEASEGSVSQVDSDSQSAPLVDQEVDSEEESEDEGPVEPLELVEESDAKDLSKDWYILKVQSNREKSILEGLQRRIKIAGLDDFFSDIIVPTEDVAEFKNGKKRIVKRKLYPGYIVVHMTITEETWFLVRETTGIGDFTGTAGKPTPLLPHEVERILKSSMPTESDGDTVKTSIPFKQNDRVRIKEGTFENFEGDVDEIDEANGRVTVMINIFGRSTPVELEHWQVEAV